MKQFYLICFSFLFQFYKVGCTVAISKMHSKFTVKWTLNENDFFRREYNYQYNDCDEMLLQNTSIKFSGIRNLSFQLGLFTKTSRFSILNRSFYVRVLPEFSHMDMPDAIYLEYALIFTSEKIYKLKDQDSDHVLHLPSGYFYTNIGNIERKDIFLNGTTTIHCLIGVKTEVKTKLPSTNHAKCNSYILRSNSSLEKKSCYSTRIKGDFIDDYIYGGQIPSLNIQTAMTILDRYSDRVKKLRVPELIDWSLGYLTKHMTSDNVIDILNLAYRKNIVSLRDSCLHYLKYKCTIKDRPLL